MIAKEKRRTRMMLRATLVLSLAAVISMALGVWITAPLDVLWSFTASFIIGLIVGHVAARLTGDWVLAPLFESPPPLRKEEKLR